MVIIILERRKFNKCEKKAAAFVVRLKDASKHLNEIDGNIILT